MSTPEMPDNVIFRKRDLMEILKRAGFPAQTIADLEASLGDPVDVRRDEALLARHGITRNVIMDRMGASP